MFEHCLYFNLSALTRKITQVWEEEFHELGLSPSHGYLLFAIYEKPEISHKELGQLLELDPSTITRFLDKLEAKGLVEKSGKWKGASFQPTREGKVVSRRIGKVMSRLYERMQTHLGKSEFPDLVGRLQCARKSMAGSSRRSKR